MSDKQTPKTFKEFLKNDSLTDDQVNALKNLSDYDFAVTFGRYAWLAATEATRVEYDDKIKAMQADIKKRDDLLMKYSMYCACKSITLCTVCWETEKILNQRGEDDR